MCGAIVSILHSASLAACVNLAQSLFIQHGSQGDVVPVSGHATSTSLWARTRHPVSYGPETGTTPLDSVGKF